MSTPKQGSGERAPGAHELAGASSSIRLAGTGTWRTLSLLFVTVRNQPLAAAPASSVYSMRSRSAQRAAEISASRNPVAGGAVLGQVQL
jgi:hypothetical protein